MQPNTPKGKKRQLRLEIPANLNASYSNSVVISQNKNEIIFDFIQVMPNDPRARIQQRVVMTPTHAKVFLRTLNETITRYEDNNGEIDVPIRPQSLADQLFSSVRQDEDDDDE